MTRRLAFAAPAGFSLAAATFVATFAAGPALAQPVLPPSALKVGTPLPAIVLQRPDLTVQLKKATYAPNGLHADHVYTVSNIGVVSSPATKLRFDCEVLYTDSALNRCGAGGLSPASYPVAALAAGGHVDVTVSPAAQFKAPALPVKSPPSSWWRLRFTVTVDPDNAVSEASKLNNAFVHVSESFDGPPPTPTPAHGPARR